MKRLTEKQATRAALWLHDALGLQDWDIQLTLTDDQPDWADHPTEGILRGCTEIAIQDKYAVIWVHPNPPVDPHVINRDAIHTLCHEYLHILAVDADWHDIMETTTRSMEQAVNRLATVFAAAYQARVKVPK